MGFGYLYLISFKIDGFGFDFTCGGGFLRSWTLFRFSLSAFVACLLCDRFFFCSIWITCFGLFGGEKKNPIAIKKIEKGTSLSYCNEMG